MPSETEKQRRAACAALAIKIGKAKKGANPVSDKMAESMTIAQLKEFCLSKVKE